MKFRIAIIIVIALLLGGGAIAYFAFPSFVENKLADFSSGKELYTFPLVGKLAGNGTVLTNAGVIDQTNDRRIAEGLTALQENQKLDAAAANKLKDMFDKQYFEHISPDGHGPGYLASKQGYSYIIVGENLAEGNFKDDSGLVDAWMASPGHRANILNTRFADIGVAVGKGTMNGKEVWLAVQEFGTPISNCPSINSDLKITIDQEKSQAQSESAELTTLKRQLDTMPHDTQNERTAYNKVVDQYNSLVNQYSTLSETLKSNIEIYNAQVRAFNACLNESTPASSE